MQDHHMTVEKEVHKQVAALVMNMENSEKEALQFSMGVVVIDLIMALVVVVDTMEAGQEQLIYAAVEVAGHLSFLAMKDAMQLMNHQQKQILFILVSLITIQDIISKMLL